MPQFRHSPADEPEEIAINTRGMNRDDGPPRDRGIAASILHHSVAFVLFFVALYMVLWFWRHNHGLVTVFASLLKPFSWGGGYFDWTAFAWGAGSVGVFMVLGFLLLETLDLYLPHSVAACLSFLFGSAMASFVFEQLAIFQVLDRPWVFIAPAVLLVILWALGYRAARRPPEVGEAKSDGVLQRVRRTLAREYETRNRIVPTTLGQRGFKAICLTLIAAITATTFYHSLLFPETYWDSFIHYLGYARIMFYERGLWEKAVAQVCYGLAVQYPHLYEFLGAGMAVAGNAWSPLPQQLLTPLCGLASTVLVYQIVLRLTRHVNFSLAMTLLYRSVPLVITYDQYASNYSFAILFVAAFLYLALLYIETGLRGYFILGTLLVAFAMHLNYLMGILWGPWAVMVVAAHALRPRREDSERAEAKSRAALEARRPKWQSFAEGAPENPPAWTHLEYRKSVFGFVFSPVFICTVLAAGAVGSTWYIRNWIVTGNPIYAFFPNIFGGENINPEVLESARIEWTANGFGIGRVGETVADRIVNSWVFFVYTEKAWQLMPFFPAFVWTGTVLLAARLAAAPFGHRSIGPIASRFGDVGLRLGIVAFSIAGALLAYHYVLAPFYLYQIVCMVPALIVLASMAYSYWRLPFWRNLFGALTIFIGLVPGLAMGLMGSKVFGNVQVGPNRYESSFDLFAFRHPLPDPQMMYMWRYHEDALMWDYVNKHLLGQKILTHDNRHLAYDISVELVHLDDWDMQQLWDKPGTEQMRVLKEAGILYYLRIPNETNHPILKGMGTDAWIEDGLVEEQRRYGENILYRIL